MPVYNRERYVSEAINSVLKQEDSNFELVVVDDGSTDQSLEIVRSIYDSRLRLFYNPHAGGAAARNAGIEAARGEFIVWIDSDDRQAPGALAALRRAVQACPDADIYYGDLEIFDDTLPSKRWYTSYPDFYGEAILPRLIRGNCLPNPGTAVRRSLYQRYGGYDVSFVRCHDYQMWSRLADSARFKKVDGILCHWRQHGESLSSAKTRTFEAKVALDMVDRYSPSRLFPDLGDDVQGQGIAFWRVSQIHQELGEPAQALRTAYRALALGVGDQERVKELERLSGSRYEPFFSVVLTTFNRPQLLMDALASLEKQQYRDFEAILVNDHGEEVEPLLGRFSYRITYVRQGRNQGPAAARNTAHSLARGRYVVYLDDDDIFLPNHLQALADALQEHPDEVVYSDALFVAERIENGVRHSLKEERRYPHDNYSRERLFVDNYIPVNTFAWPRAVAAEIGEFDEALPGLEDWDFLLRLAARLPFHHVQRETVQVRMRVGDATSDRRSQQAFKDYPALYRELYSRHSDFNSPAVREGRQAMLKRFGVLEHSKTAKVFPVEDWLKARSFTPAQKGQVAELLQRHNGGPSFGVVLLDLQGEPERLKASLASLSQLHQTYTNIQPIVLTVNEAVIDGAVHVVQVTQDNWLVQLNGLLSQAALDWFSVAIAGDEFTENGLLVACLELVISPEYRAVFCDEIYRQADEDLGLALRPSFNLDYVLSFPAGMARHWLFRRDVFLEAGCFNTQFPNAFEFEFILRLVNQGGLAGLGHISEPLLITEMPALANVENERLAIIRHLQARGYPEAQVTAAKPGRYHLEYKHAGNPVVSILITAGEHLSKLQRCIEGLLGSTAYQTFEILLVESHPLDQAVHEWLLALAELQEAKLRVVQPESQNTIAMLNDAANQASGDYLLFLASDTAILEEDWLDKLLNHAQRAEVGGVGGRLLTPDGKIAQGMQILGLQGPLGNPYIGEKIDEPGYMQRLQVDQNVSALSQDCLMLPRDLFIQLKGLDEKGVPSPYAVTDLCLRIREAGYLLVWSPSVQLMLDRQDSTQVTAQHQDAMYAKWLPQLARDPAYNPNFSLVQPGGFKLADTQISWRPLDAWRPLPVVLAHPADTMGCGHYRVMQPFNALCEAGMVDGGISEGLMHVVDFERYNPDAVILQRQIGEVRLEAMRQMKAFSRAFKVYELDDYLPNLPMKSVHRQHMPRDIVKSLRKGLSYVDRFVVSTDVMAEAFSDFHPDIRVVKNRLDPRWWGGLPVSARRVSKKPRVGWAGGSSHTGDLEMVADVVKELASEVEWVFFGMCPDKLKPYVHEFHEGVAIESYAKKLASLNLDLALAPVEQNLFNECKSNLRLLEYGACGLPVICSDVRCYQGDGLPVTRVKNRFRDWVDAIRAHINDLDSAARAGDELRAAVLNGWMLEGENLEAWRKAWLPD
ncbi:glycosyltransferase [Stutzerimonas stutzeri]|uniref:glycosyltransferase n=1 Tax=Stutzerimonas stutzeri TaxID=316 RepID=UPI00265A67B8|nr:glycosyltransferase [Stutzerimonas stutzeri]MCF6783147.1 glycosyltransferase [Stutzerimonas stutzeri]MCF6806095.1 glycosyltransferase [Stutzerimonas stutzeri]